MRRLIDGLARTLAVLAAACIGLLMMATVADVGRRTLTGRALPGTVQYSELLMVSLVFLGLALAQRRKEHVGVNLITARLPDAWSRALRLPGLVVAIAFIGWMTIETAQEAYGSWQRNEIRIGLQAVRVWPARFLIPIGLVALLLQLLADVVDVARGRLRQSAIVLLLLMMVPLGMALDPVSILLISVPLAYPVVTELGFDGIWFGILTVKMIELGLITPPVGLNAYVIAGSVEGISVEQAFRGLSFFFAIDVVAVALLLAFPALVTWLPAFVR